MSVVVGVTVLVPAVHLASFLPQPSPQGIIFRPHRSDASSNRRHYLHFFPRFHSFVFNFCEIGKLRNACLFVEGCEHCPCLLPYLSRRLRPTLCVPERKNRILCRPPRPSDSRTSRNSTHTEEKKRHPQSKERRKKVVLRRADGGEVLWQSCCCCCWHPEGTEEPKSLIFGTRPGLRSCFPPVELALPRNDLGSCP